MKSPNIEHVEMIEKKIESKRYEKLIEEIAGILYSELVKLHHKRMDNDPVQNERTGS